MTIEKTSCCAIQDINGLNSYMTGKDAMTAFCQRALLSPPKFLNARDVGRKDEISSFYLFTAAVGPRYHPYGEMFRDFITENSLGDVYASPRRPNKAWHPDHENQVYVWMPDLKALRAWWKTNDPGTRPVASVSVESVACQGGV